MGSLYHYCYKLPVKRDPGWQTVCQPPAGAAESAALTHPAPGAGAEAAVRCRGEYHPSMGVIARNAEHAIRDALSRRPLPDSINVSLCFGGPMVLPLKQALEDYADWRRRGEDEGILAQRADPLALIDELLEPKRRTGST